MSFPTKNGYSRNWCSVEQSGPKSSQICGLFALFCIWQGALSCSFTLNIKQHNSVTINPLKLNLKKIYHRFWLLGCLGKRFVCSPWLFCVRIVKGWKKRLLHLIACVLDKIIEPVCCLHLVYIKTEKSNELWKCKKEKLLSLFKHLFFFHQRLNSNMSTQP